MRSRRSTQGTRQVRASKDDAVDPKSGIAAARAGTHDADAQERSSDEDVQGQPRGGPNGASALKLQVPDEKDSHSKATRQQSFSGQVGNSRSERRIDRAASDHTSAQAATVGAAFVNGSHHLRTEDNDKDNDKLDFIVQSVMRWAVMDACLTFLKQRELNPRREKLQQLVEKLTRRSHRSGTGDGSDAGGKSVSAGLNPSSGAGSGSGEKDDGKDIQSATFSQDTARASKLSAAAERAVLVECSQCGSNVAAARFAPHYEKCLGKGGRSSSRAATARLKASVSYQDASDGSDGDGDDFAVTSRKRQRHGGSGSGANSVTSKRQRGLSGASTPAVSRCASPTPRDNADAGAQGGTHASATTGRGGLPPSGRAAKNR
ncbi:SAGA-associated factor 11-like [Porphyridium purpureum]|uniref:SAGA-associated factor 11 n=1 Tax=Porphyridium purpureum TaxID=35688 RepID=A0A5J4YRK6_PORPP|nr:SAGA-associated factor 11-like [Porphyridium purpureum]|eukprot:POR4354..scf229_5